MPVTVIAGKDGKILWIGHPAQLEPVLKAVDAAEGLAANASSVRPRSSRPRSIQASHSRVKLSFCYSV